MDGDHVDHHQMVWTQEEMSQLMQQINANKISKRKFGSAQGSAKKVDWTSVSVPGRSEEECKKAFITMTGYIQKSLTVNNICDMVLFKLDSNKIHSDMIPGAPVKPVSPYQMFANKQTKKIMKKHPDLSFMEALAKAKSKWSTMPADTQERYKLEYQRASDIYKEALSVFSNGVVMRPVKERRTNKGRLQPYQMYCMENATPMRESKAAFQSLSEDQKLEWIWKAVEECQTRKAAHEANPGHGTPPVLSLTSQEMKLLLTSQDLQEKPPRTVRAYFIKLNAGTEKELGPKFKALTEKKYNKLITRLIEVIELFLNRLSGYLERRAGTLSADEFGKWEVDRIKYEECLRMLRRSASTRSRKRKSVMICPLSDTDEDIVFTQKNSNVGSPLKGSLYPNKKIKLEQEQTLSSDDSLLELPSPKKNKHKRRSHELENEVHTDSDEFE